MLGGEGMRAAKQHGSLSGLFSSQSCGEEGIEDDMLRLQLTLQLK